MNNSTRGGGGGGGGGMWMSNISTRRHLTRPVHKNAEEELLLGEEESTTDLNIEVINNRIYFYEEINTKSVLYLCKCLRTLEIKLLNLQNDYSLNEPPPIYLHIQSSGGDAFAGLSAMNVIENTKVKVVCVVDGFVASAATFLLLGATGGRLMRKNSTVLIHQIRTEFWGRYSELQDEMHNSQNLMKNIKRIYKKKSSMPLDRIDTILNKEVYLTHKQCLKYGLVTEII
jgi:ATP-dependent Clp protease protease subunit